MIHPTALYIVSNVVKLIMKLLQSWIKHLKGNVLALDQGRGQVVCGMCVWGIYTQFIKQCTALADQNLCITLSTYHSLYIYRERHMRAYMHMFEHCLNLVKIRVGAV